MYYLLPTTYNKILHIAIPEKKIPINEKRPRQTILSSGVVIVHILLLVESSFFLHSIFTLTLCSHRQVSAVLNAESINLIRSIHILNRAIHIAPLETSEAVQRPAVSNRSKGHTEGRLELDHISFDRFLFNESTVDALFKMKQVGSLGNQLRCKFQATLTSTRRVAIFIPICTTLNIQPMRTR